MQGMLICFFYERNAMNMFMIVSTNFSLGVCTGMTFTDFVSVSRVPLSHFMILWLAVIHQQVPALKL